jgi:cytidylate kinase
MKSPFRNIIVSGDVGVGSSTLGRGLAKALSWKFVSAGEISRQYHLDNNIPLWNKAAVPANFENFLDDRLFSIAKNESNYIIESHYAGWFARDLRDVFRILLICDLPTIQARISKRRSTHDESPEEVVERMKQLKDKFRQLYSTDDYQDPKFFHLVIDTSKKDVSGTLETALNNFRHPQKDWC